MVTEKQARFSELW